MDFLGYFHPLAVVINFGIFNAFFNLGKIHSSYIRDSNLKENACEVLIYFKDNTAYVESLVSRWKDGLPHANSLSD